ncbi:hypothetical protein DV702_05885 [Sporosarcina sp. PTS2304]|uniref:hypothetical protein n=1 Tax=Sporosarcina sp. PTS2304 TaxID=2283194 RepID=UPI000E0D87FC|nr:hypothetical protein [Sporosarcina sp. PTS2304]AXH99310.1 hypothetical protein DV702_05885 [Sporosarcina sp. PTS2304]
MHFRKRYSRNIIVRAMVQGVAIGLAAVFVIGLTIFTTGEKGANSTKKVATSGPNAEEEQAADGEAVTMFVKQYGVFSAKEAATDFVATDPSLAKTVIFPVNGQFYVWGATWVKESHVVLNETEDAFKKKIRVVDGTCKQANREEVKKALLADDLSKIELSVGGGEKKKGTDLQKKMTAITAFTKDSSIARLHLLGYYSNEDPCFKIQF